MQNFLENCWYMAGRSDELGPGGLLSRKLLNIDVVFVRKLDATLTALEDRCPHRFAPLSKGKLVQGNIQCGYHGLTFDTAGKCVHNPFGPTPAAAKVRSFIVAERYESIWIWFGDEERAQEDFIPDLGALHTPNIKRISGYHHVRANYELLTDNIMDLTHVPILHAGGIDDALSLPRRVYRDGDAVVACYSAENIASMGNLFDFIHVEGPIDNFTDVRWEAPAITVAMGGFKRSADSWDKGMKAPIGNYFTPETETTSHYFWTFCHAGPNIPGLDRKIKEKLEVIFTEQDIAMIEAQQERMGREDFWKLKPILLKQDASAVMVRRALAAMIAKENNVEVEPEAELADL